MVIEKKYDKRLSQNNRLIRMLHTLQRKEVKAFHQFLQSPYHNSNQAVLRFFEQLKDHHPEFRPDKLDKAALYQEVFGRKYDENHMNQLLTKTCRALEAFFAFEELRNDELLVTKLKRNAFSKRQLPNQYSKVSKQIQSRLGEEPVDESQHYLERFLLNKNLLYNAELEQKQKESNI